MPDAMDRRDLVAAIERAISAGISPVDETGDPEKRHTFGAHVRTLTTVNSPSPEIVKDVMQVLERQTDLAWLMKSFFHPGPGPGGVGILPIKVANWLLAKSLSLPGGPAEAISTLEDFCRTNTAWGRRVVIVYGAYVEELIKLSDETSLLPIQDLQPSQGLDHLVEAVGPIVWHLPMVRSDDLDLTPSLCALAERFKMSPAVQTDSKAKPGWSADHPKRFEHMERLAEALVLVPDTMPQCVHKWIETETVDAIPGLTGGSPGDFEFMEIFPQRHVRHGPLDRHTVSTRLQRFMQLSPDVRRKLSIPLRRLAIARARRSVGDRATDLGIALEAMFGDGSKSEIGHKVAVRGSLFASETAKDRLLNFQILKASYDLRSKHVHGGRVESDRIVMQAGITATDIVERSEGLLRVALNKVVDSGTLPSWREVELAIGTGDTPGANKRG